MIDNRRSIGRIKALYQVLSNRFLSKQQDGKKQELRPPFKGSWSTCNHEILCLNNIKPGLIN
jgi:hypothetical protein